MSRHVSVDLADLDTHVEHNVVILGEIRGDTYVILLDCVDCDTSIIEEDYS